MNMVFNKQKRSVFKMEKDYHFKNLKVLIFLFLHFDI